MVNFASYGDGLQYLNGAGWWGLVSVILMSQAGGMSLKNTTHITKNPLKIGGWFLIGATVSVLVNALRMRESGFDSRSYILHKRVSENEQTHSLLRTLKFHLASRKMSVWDANPR